MIWGKMVRFPVVIMEVQQKAVHLTKTNKMVARRQVTKGQLVKKLGESKKTGRWWTKKTTYRSCTRRMLCQRPPRRSMKASWKALSPRDCTLTSLLSRKTNSLIVLFKIWRLRHSLLLRSVRGKLSVKSMSDDALRSSRRSSHASTAAGRSTQQTRPATCTCETNTTMLRRRSVIARLGKSFELSVSKTAKTSFKNCLSSRKLSRRSCRISSCCRAAWCSRFYKSRPGRKTSLQWIKALTSTNHLHQIRKTVIWKTISDIVPSIFSEEDPTKFSGCTVLGAYEALTSNSAWTPNTLSDTDMLNKINIRTVLDRLRQNEYKYTMNGQVTDDMLELQLISSCMTNFWKL